MTSMRLAVWGSEHSASPWRGAATNAFGGLLGGLVGGGFVVAAMSLLKQMQDFLGRQATWILMVAPLVGLALTTLVLHGIGRSADSTAISGSKRPSDWRTFPAGVVRADITGDIVNTAGQEERFPWRLAPNPAARDLRHGRPRSRHGNRSSCGLPRCGRGHLPRRPRSELAQAAAAACSGRGRSGCGGTDGDPTGGHGVRARDRKAKRSSLRAWPSDRGAARWTRGLVDQHHLRARLHSRWFPRSRRSA